MNGAHRCVCSLNVSLCMFLCVLCPPSHWQVQHFSTWLPSAHHDDLRRWVSTGGHFILVGPTAGLTTLETLVCVRCGSFVRWGVCVCGLSPFQVEHAASGWQGHSTLPCRLVVRVHVVVSFVGCFTLWMPLAVLVLLHIVKYFWRGVVSNDSWRILHVWVQLGAVVASCLECCCQCIAVVPDGESTGLLA